MPEADTALDTFLRVSGGSSWRHLGFEVGFDLIELVSQVWQGHIWRHKVALFRPSKPASDALILEITGGEINQTDLDRAAVVSEETNLAVAVLFDIPNQPLWEMVEDELIAFTFEQFLVTLDPAWPLLFPMAASAVRAMDCLAEFTHGEQSKFIVTGASKRGWTAWLAAATGDRRIIGLVPRVFDNLNIPTQMRSQVEYWGGYSQQIEDYTERGLQAALATPDGHRLGQIVDPFAYRHRVTAPTLIMTGTNDPYWTVDAARHYFYALPQPAWFRTIANAGHGVGDPAWMESGPCAFARACAGCFKMPSLAWEHQDGCTIVKTESPVRQLRLYRAFSADRWFAEASWSVESLIEPGESDQEFVFKHAPINAFSASFVELEFIVPGEKGCVVSTIPYLQAP